MKMHVTDQMVAVVVGLRIYNKCRDCGKDLMRAPLLYGTLHGHRLDGDTEVPITMSTETNDSSIDFFKSCYRCTKSNKPDDIKYVIRYEPPFPLSSKDKNAIAKIVNDGKFDEPGLHMAKALVIESIYAEMATDDIPHETLKHLDLLREALHIPRTDDIPAWFRATVKHIDDFTVSKLAELFATNDCVADYFQSIIAEEVDSRATQQA